MANIKSQKKRIRTNEAARMRNKAVKSELKTLTKHVQSAVAEGDAEKAVNAYNALKDWGMQLSLGSVTSKPAAATSVKHNEDRIFALPPSASSPATIEGKDDVFQLCFMDPNQGSASAPYISEKKLGTKIAVIWKNDDVYSKGIHETFVA